MTSRRAALPAVLAALVLLVAAGPRAGLAAEPEGGELDPGPDPDLFEGVPLGGAGLAEPYGIVGCPGTDVFGFRSGGGRLKCVTRYGGTKASESAVEAALAWLARNQEADGRWSCEKHGGRDDERFDIAVTGLATLAFLGAGYTPTGESKCRENVKKAVAWLLSQQQENGAFAARGGQLGYLHGIAGLAVVEAYGMTRDAKIRKSAQRAVEYAVNVHQCPGSGWRYAPKQRADLSVTGWFVMQLKSAKVAGLRVDGKAFAGALAFVDEVTDPETGGAGYTNNKSFSPRRTAIGLTCRLFLGGDPRREALLKKASAYLLENLPASLAEAAEAEDAAAKRPDYYYWYYGTLGLFQVGGEPWKKWNGVLRNRLVETQCTAKDGDNNGSWDYENGQGLGGRRAGRVFTTALGALCLETYYRYLRMYGN